MAPRVGLVCHLRLHPLPQRTQRWLYAVPGELNFRVSHLRRLQAFKRYLCSGSHRHFSAITYSGGFTLHPDILTATVW